MVTLERVVEQTLVRLGRRRLERIAVVEIHIDRLSSDLRTRLFGHKREGDALVRLDTHHQAVAVQRMHARRLEQMQRNIVKGDHHARVTGGQALAGAQQKGHAGPPP